MTGLSVCVELDLFKGCGLWAVGRGVGNATTCISKPVHGIKCACPQERLYQGQVKHYTAGELKAGVTLHAV